MREEYLPFDPVPRFPGGRMSPSSLAECFTMVWATGWGEEANKRLSPHFGLPEFPFVVFPPLPFEPSAKVPAIDEFVGHHPAAWVDDLVTPEARRWAEERDAPTLLVEVDHAVGLTKEALDALLKWRQSIG